MGHEEHTPPNDDTARRAVRFEAIVHPGEAEVALDRVADLDLDRVPDREGGVRVIIDAHDAVRLLERGYEVRLVRPHHVMPLDSSLIADEGHALAWLEEQVKDIRREGA